MDFISETLSSPSDWTFGLSQTVALAAVALFGYLFGRNTGQGRTVPVESEQLKQAMRIARDLESIAETLRQDLGYHRSQVERFKQRLSKTESEEDALQELQREAEEVLAPTLQLVGQLSAAYDKIRNQSQVLAQFTGGRTDPLTGLSNPRGLEEQLEVELRGPSGTNGKCSIAVISIERIAKPEEPLNRLERDDLMRRAATVLKQQLREADSAARYGSDEFVVVMPGTPLRGATVFGTRLRNALAEEIAVDACCGITESLPSDTPKALLARGDSALYSARATGNGSQYFHTGEAIFADKRRSVVSPAAAESHLPEAVVESDLSASAAEVTVEKAEACLPGV